MKTKTVASLFLLWLVIWLLKPVEIPKFLYISTIALLTLLLILWNLYALHKF